MIRALGRYFGHFVRWQYYLLRAALHVNASLWRASWMDMGRLRPTAWRAFAAYLHGPTADPQAWMERWLKKRHGVSVLDADHGQEEEAKAAYNDARKSVELRYVRAKLSGSHRNRWRWTWWILRDEQKVTADALEMPEWAARLQIAEWLASVRNQSGEWDVAKLQRWYAMRRDNVKLHVNTRTLIAKLIGEMREVS